jgi:hypothetical protein
MTKHPRFAEKFEDVGVCEGLYGLGYLELGKSVLQAHVRLAFWLACQNRAAALKWSLHPFIEIANGANSLALEVDLLCPHATSRGDLWSAVLQCARR